MKADEYLDFVVDIYRAEHPGITDGAVYEVMLQELSPTHGIAMLMAQRIGADISTAASVPTRAVNDDAFLKSFEWRRVRMMVFERDGAVCACCGRTPKDGVRLNVDHIKSRKRYPELALDPNNLQVLCEDCNHGKGNKYNTDWRKEKA